MKKYQKIFFLIGFFMVVCIVGIGYFLLQSSKEFYSIESRLENIKSTKIVDHEGEYETIGWVRVQDTDLDMPIIHTLSQKFEYPVTLEHYSWHYLGDGKFHNMIHIMGHNIYNLSSTPEISSNQFKRFEELMSFVYFDEAKKSKYIQLTLEGKEYLYKIFSVAFIDSYDVGVAASKYNYDKEDMKAYLRLLRKNNLYEYDVDVSVNDDILSLVTCTRFFGNEVSYDIVVSGRMIREGEKIEDYSIRENSDNYNKIKEILEGDDNDEDSV